MASDIEIGQPIPVFKPRSITHFADHEKWVKLRV